MGDRPGGRGGPSKKEPSKARQGKAEDQQNRLTGQLARLRKRPFLTALDRKKGEP